MDNADLQTDDPSTSSKPYLIFILGKPLNLSKLLVTVSFMRDDEESAWPAMSETLYWAQGTGMQ